MSEYYMPEPGDSRLHQAWRYLRHRRRPRPRFPRHIQVQTVSRCNAACLFCGYQGIKDTLPHGEMDDALFRRIADECGRHFVGRVSPYLMNEPLLDRKLPERIAYLNKVRRFGTKTKINSNGLLLTAEMSEALIDSGLRHLWISVQGYSEETFRKSMGLPLDKVLGNIDRFLDIRARKGARLPKLSITTLRTRLVEHELEYAARYWGERQVNFKIHGLDNRSGKNLKDLAVSKPVLRRNCDLFLKQAYILYNGDMVFCCHDWKRSVVLGNVGERSIADIWNDPAFERLIRAYHAGDFSELAICRDCMSG